VWRVQLVSPLRFVDREGGRKTPFSPFFLPPLLFPPLEISRNTKRDESLSFSAHNNYNCVSRGLSWPRVNLELLSLLFFPPSFALPTGILFSSFFFFSFPPWKKNRPLTPPLFPKCLLVHSPRTSSSSFPSPPLPISPLSRRCTRGHIPWCEGKGYQNGSYPFSSEKIFFPPSFSSPLPQPTCLCPLPLFSLVRGQKEDEIQSFSFQRFGTQTGKPPPRPPFFLSGRAVLTTVSHSSADDPSSFFPRKALFLKGRNIFASLAQGELSPAWREGLSPLRKKRRIAWRGFGKSKDFLWRRRGPIAREERKVYQCHEEILSSSFANPLEIRSSPSVHLGLLFLFLPLISVLQCSRSLLVKIEWHSTLLPLPFTFFGFFNWNNPSFLFPSLPLSGFNISSESYSPFPSRRRNKSEPLSFCLSVNSRDRP